MESKEPLTLEYVVKHKMNHIDCVKYFKPDYSDFLCDMIIWECTCFPFSNEEMINQLNQMFIK
jgi:hypothetical protein